MRAVIAGGRFRRRGGFTLIELLVITLLTAVVVGGMMSTLMRQQKFYRGTADIIETRSQIRQAAGILPTDLRGISTIGGDLTTMTDSAMVFRATIGSSVVCVVGGGAIIMPPLALANGNTLTSWSSPPVAGDIAFIYDDGPTSVATDDVWRAYTVAGAASPIVGGCPSSTGLTGAGDATSASYTFNYAGGLSPSIVVGAPIRFVRTTRYSLYRAPDSKWYLGYCSPACGAGGPQPIAGPFRAYGGVNTGVSFSYLDANGAVTLVPANVAQVSIVVRGETSSAVDIAGLPRQKLGDSLRFSVAIRNRK